MWSGAGGAGGGAGDQCGEAGGKAELAEAGRAAGIEAASQAAQHRRQGCGEATGPPCVPTPLAHAAPDTKLAPAHPPPCARSAEAAVIAAVLHDVVDDTEATLAQVGGRHPTPLGGGPTSPYEGDSLAPSASWRVGQSQAPAEAAPGRAPRPAQLPGRRLTQPAAPAGGDRLWPCGGWHGGQGQPAQRHQPARTAAAAAAGAPSWRPPPSRAEQSRAEQSTPAAWGAAAPPGREAAGPAR